MGTRHLITCLVADEHPAIVESVSHLLEHVGGFTVVGRAADGSEAPALIRELEPDLALVDSSLPQLDAVSLIRRVAGEHRPTRIVVYSGGDDAAQAREAIGAGAAGYVLKASSLEGLERAVQLAPRWDVRRPRAGRGRPERSELTSRETRGARTVGRGPRQRRDRQDLEISALTVRTHTKNAMEKLQAATRSQAVATALRRALTSSLRDEPLADAPPAPDAAPASQEDARGAKSRGMRTTTTDEITCLLIDDHPAMIDAMTRVLDLAGIRIVGSASTAEEGLALLARRPADVALLDLRLPDMDGIALAQQIARTATRRGRCSIPAMPTRGSRGRRWRPESTA